MKQTLNVMSVVAIAIVSLFAINLNTAFAGIEIVYFGGAHLPNDGTGSSPSWAAASSNRMIQIRNQLAGIGNPVGTGKEMAMITALDYSRMVTTPNPTPEAWNGVVATGTGEHGNRYHVAFGVFANDGSTFVPSSVTLTMQPYVWDVSSYKPYGSFTTTTLGTVNNFRLRMSPGVDGKSGTSDDTIATIQNGSDASTGFIFGGQGKGYLPSGSGTDQQRINNTITWMQANKLAIKYTCTVGSVSVEKWVYGNDMSHPQPTITGTTTFSWKSIGEPVKFQKSSNLVDWASDGNWVWKREGTIGVIPLIDYPSAPKYFYRLARQ